MPGVALQVITPAVEPVMWAIAVRLSPATFPQGRDAVMAQMAELGIETRPGFYPASAMHHLYGHQELPASEEVGASVLVLPSSPSLDGEKVSRICDSLATLARP
jgi:perosamine synthetase